MSAAAQSTIPRGFCRTPVSFFQRQLEICNYTEAKVFGLILCQTVGNSREWKEIHAAEFDFATNVSRESWLSAIESLENTQKLIRTRKGPSGRTEYAVALSIEKEIEAADIEGECPECHARTHFKTEFIAVPHAAFRKLGAAVDHSTYSVVMMIIRHSLRWSSAKGFYSTPYELEINDFERFTGLSHRSITAGLAKAKQLGLINRVDRKGRPSEYEAIPEAFGTLKPREKRTVEREEKAKHQKPETEKIQGKPAQSQVEESIPESVSETSQVYAQCTKCGRFVHPLPLPKGEIVTEERSEHVDRPPRPGPRREYTRKKTNLELYEESIEKRYA